MKTFTIIGNNQLLGIIKLQEDLVKELGSDMAILLTQDNIVGDVVALSFKLQVIQLEQNAKP